LTGELAEETGCKYVIHYLWGGGNPIGLQLLTMKFTTECDTASFLPLSDPQNITTILKLLPNFRYVKWM